MSMEHDQIPAAKNCTPIRYLWANAAARIAQTLPSGYHLGVQLDNNTLWFVTPSAIIPMSGSTPGAAVGADTASATVDAGTCMSPTAQTGIWKELKTGAGGFVTGIEVVPDGAGGVVAFCRTDTSGAYIWNTTTSQWDQVFTADRIPEAAAIDAGQGAYAIAIAPSDIDRLYLMIGRSIYTSRDRGNNWSKTAFAGATSGCDPNDDWRFNSCKMAVDPNNHLCVLVGTTNQGIWETTDGGATWTRLTAVPSGTADQGGITGIAYDAASGTTGVRTNVAWCSPWAGGAYRRTTPTGAFAAVAGGPANVTSSVCVGGAYYATDASRLWKYSSSAWTTLLTMTAGDCQSVSLSPTDPTFIVVGSEAGYFNVSKDAGTTWLGFDYSQTMSAADIPWLAYSGAYMTAARVRFDPVVANKLWLSAGVGVWTMALPSPYTGYPQAITWQSQSAGIENLSTRQIHCPPNGFVLCMSGDRPCFRFETPAEFDVYRSSYGPGMDGKTHSAFGSDWASGAPWAIWTIANAFNPGVSGISLDAGRTWSKFAGLPGGDDSNGGCLAAATENNAVWAVSNNRGMYYTTNRGATWTLCSVPGIPPSGETGWGWSYWFTRFIVAADRVSIGTYYAYNYLSSVGGVFQSTDGGATWTRVSVTIFPGSGYNARMLSVPGQAGHLFFSSGPQSPGPYPHAQSFYRSTNGGTTWTTVANVQEVRAYGFGPDRSPSYPAIYIVGWVSGVYGIYRSIDSCASWTLLGTWPRGWLDQPICISGDADGRVFLGFQGSGYVYYEPDDITPHDRFTVSVSWGANGSVSPGTGRFLSGSSPEFDVIPASGWRVWELTIDGVVQGGTPSSYTFSNLSENHSVACTFRPINDSNPPTIPTGLALNVVSSTEIDLTWNPSTDAETRVDHYVVRRDGSVVQSPSGTSWQSTGLTASTQYAFTVSAVDLDGNESSQCDAQSATTLGSGQTQVAPTWTFGASTDFGYAANPAIFADVPIGVAASTRTVAVFIGAILAVTGVTIGGISATKAVGDATSAKGSWWYARVPTGTTATISIAGTGGLLFGVVGIEVYAVYNAAATPSATGATAYGVHDDPTSVSLTIPQAGAALAGIYVQSVTQTAVPTWINATGDDHVMAASPNQQQVAAAHTTSIGPRTISVSGYPWGGTALVAVAWAPG